MTTTNQPVLPPYPTAWPVESLQVVQLREVLAELQAGDRRPGTRPRAGHGGAAGGRPLSARRCARTGQDPHGVDVGQDPRRQLHPDPVHPRPAAVRHCRHPGLPTVDRALRRRTRPDVRQLRAGRRDQPSAGQGAVGAARGDGGAPGLARRRHPSAAVAVPGARHPEPDRVRGRLSTARSAA